MGGTITSLDPPSILVQSGEYFLTVNGTDLRGTVKFDGPAGQFELETNADFPGSVVAWVPQDIVLKYGVYKVTVGDSNVANFTVIKPGLPKLTLHLPELLTAITKGRLGNTIDYEVNAIGGEGEITVKCDPKSGSTFPYGESSIRCTAYDLSGAQADGLITVNVWDGTAPSISIPKSFKVEAEKEDGAYVKFDTSAVDDVDGGLQVTCSKESGALFPNGKTVVNCEAIDKALNPAYGSFEVFVEPKDPGRLALKVPDKVVEVATDKEGAEVYFEVIAYGSADPDPVIQCDPYSGAWFSMGRTKVYCKAEDDFGGRAEGGFEVEVVERYGLKFPDVTAEAMSPAGTPVAFEPAAEDWATAITCTPGSGSMFALGTTTVDCESTDAKGRRAGGTFTVNVADTIAPHIGKISANLRAAAEGRVPVQVEVEATDVADAMPRCSISTLASDAGSAFDWRVKSDLEVDVRADARPFRIQVSCVDASGNRSTDFVPVTLPGMTKYKPIAH